MGRLGTNGRRPAKWVGATLAAALVALAGLAGAAGTSSADDADAGNAARPGPARDAGRAPVPTGGHVVPADLEDVEHMCALLTACERLPLPAGLVPLDFVGCTRAMYAELASAAAEIGRAHV